MRSAWFTSTKTLSRTTGKESPGTSRTVTLFSRGPELLESHGNRPAGFPSLRQIGTYQWWIRSTFNHALRLSQRVAPRPVFRCGVEQVAFGSGPYPGRTVVSQIVRSGVVPCSALWTWGERRCRLQRAVRCRDGSGPRDATSQPTRWASGIKRVVSRADHDPDSGVIFRSPTVYVHCARDTP